VIVCHLPTKGIKMTRLEFAELVKNMGGYAGVASAIGCGKSTVGHMVANGYISSKWRGEFMLAAHRAVIKSKLPILIG